MKNGPSGKMKWSAAVLATAVAAGGVYALPSVFADGSPEPQAESTQAKDPSSVTTSANAASVPIAARAVSASTSAAKKGDAQVVQPVISVDPKKTSAGSSRSALTVLEGMSMETVKRFALASSEKEYAKLVEVRNRAVEVSNDPNAPADRVFATSRKLEEAIDRYNDKAIGGANAVSKTLAQAKSDTLNGRSESQLDAPGKLVLLGVQEAQNKLAADSSKAGALSAYKYFLLRVSEANDLQPYQPTDYSAVLNQYETNIKARMESAGSYAKKTDKLQKAYAVSAQALKEAINRSAGKNALDAAKIGVETTYAALTEGLTLADALLQAEPLLESTTGKEKGQYPPSSVGTLRRDLHKVERALETAKTVEPLTQARADLAKAIADFKAKRNA
ncbi:hypothetical protein B9G55_02545 [Saccharibacillus sp. O16]|nr:hypothetical protein B9G55_02545 [Saccharibacillus sp. O16]